jgi:hypothetical protein
MRRAHGVLSVDRPLDGATARFEHARSHEPEHGASRRTASTVASPALGHRDDSSLPALWMELDLPTAGEQRLELPDARVHPHRGCIAAGRGAISHTRRAPPRA